MVDLLGKRQQESGIKMVSRRGAGFLGGCNRYEADAAWRRGNRAVDEKRRIGDSKIRCQFGSPLLA